jgi:hypothetical protein
MVQDRKVAGSIVSIDVVNKGTLYLYKKSVKNAELICCQGQWALYI